MNEQQLVLHAITDDGTIEPTVVVFDARVIDFSKIRFIEARFGEKEVRNFIMTVPEIIPVEEDFE